MFQTSVLLILTVFLFLYGFFPISNSNTNFKNDPPTQIENNTVALSTVYQTHFTKVVFVVIDALRWDFVQPNLLPRIVNLMNNKGCLSKVTVESPTVTLPRIKALTTGGIPQYIDVVRNLASSEVLGDSWLHSAQKKGLKTVFYGDNTWEKLFPGFFERSEFTTSFFVWDFTEVDSNVTRNVHLELDRQDWDIMILHYLGLDHIGHVWGPFSHKIPPKLEEMDKIINEIYEKTDENTLILVTGDHGMRDAGGHGGTTHSEIIVPLVAIGLNCKNSSFMQTDIPANLAILLALNIPSTSIGSIQRQLLHSLMLQQYLYALRYNTELLLNKSASSTTAKFKNATQYHLKYLMYDNKEDANAAITLYEDCSQEITENIYKMSISQDMHSLYIALATMLCLLIDLAQRLLNPHLKADGFLNNVTLLCIILVHYFAGVDLISKFLFFFSFGFFILKTIKVKLKAIVPENGINTFLLVASALHPLTFISTSFIEEEHYYWIFFSTSLLVLLAIQSWQKKNIVELQLLYILLILRFSMDLNSTVENSVQNTDNWYNTLIKESHFVYHQLFLIMGLVLVYLVTTSTFSYVNFPIVVLIYFLKSTLHHNTFLGKLLWGCLLLKKVYLNCSWKEIWILAATLLSKPHNVVLISFAAYTGDHLCKVKHFTSIPALTVANYMLSNCFYFLQGHRNTLAAVDISIGYTGLSEYNPVLVISQVLIHTYTFPVLFSLCILENIPKQEDKNKFWQIMLLQRTSVVILSCTVIIIFRHHLFIWSVFAPKLIIESVHTLFLFIMISLWTIKNYVKKIFLVKVI